MYFDPPVVTLSANEGNTPNYIILDIISGIGARMCLTCALRFS